MNVKRTLLLIFLMQVPTLLQAEQLSGDNPLTDAQEQGIDVEIQEDHDDVFEAVQDGLIHPFSAVQADVDKYLKGRIIKVELDGEGNEWKYELKMIFENRVYFVEYDAATLEMLTLSGRNIQAIMK
uniref:PepSY domain-containing protein n=1 Tax=Thaumasiovibrio occultus TaxID=1891184 RepID=UPI000B351FCC|nr:hypothetical protein [Thaumasiovibrio occultus]